MGGHVKFYRGTACTLSVDRDTVWVATEGTDVPFHPFERLDLILETSIEVAVFRTPEFWGGKEAE
jgi:hypothetical protein